MFEGTVAKPDWTEDDWDRWDADERRSRVRAWLAAVVRAYADVQRAVARLAEHLIQAYDHRIASDEPGSDGAEHLAAYERDVVALADAEIALATAGAELSAAEAWAEGHELRSEFAALTALLRSEQGAFDERDLVPMDVERQAGDADSEINLTADRLNELLAERREAARAAEQAEQDLDRAEAALTDARPVVTTVEVTSLVPAGTLDLSDVDIDSDELPELPLAPIRQITEQTDTSAFEDARAARDAALATAREAGDRVANLDSRIEATERDLSAAAARAEKLAGPAAQAALRREEAARRRSYVADLHSRIALVEERMARHEHASGGLAVPDRVSIAEAQERAKRARQVAHRKAEDAARVTAAETARIASELLIGPSTSAGGPPVPPRVSKARQALATANDELSAAQARAREARALAAEARARSAQSMLRGGGSRRAEAARARAQHAAADVASCRAKVRRASTRLRNAEQALDARSPEHPDLVRAESPRRRRERLERARQLAAETEAVREARAANDAANDHASVAEAEVAGIGRVWDLDAARARRDIAQAQRDELARRVKDAV